tara:strand:- start:2248 stop:2565 length:318 start_codon:yes stop_codon:yes gene_type:complete
MVKFRDVNVPAELQDLIPQFMIYTLIDFKTLREFFISKDDIEMRQICHKLLGSVASFGFEDLDRMLSELQFQLREKNWIKVSNLMKDLDQYFLFLEVMFPSIEAA